MDGGVVVLLLIAWIVGTIIAATIASNRNVSIGLVILLSILFSPVIGVLVACLMTPEARSAAVNAAATVREKKCPQCAEMVKKEAVICRFCRYDFGADIASEEAARLADEEAKKAAEEARKTAWEADAPQRAAETEAQAKKDRKALLVARGVFALMIMIAVSLIIVSATHLLSNTTSGASAATTPKAPAPTAAIPSPWTVSKETNPVTGKVTVYAESDAGNNQAMVIRETGRKVELFINTNEFLETTNNINSGLVGITYRIDKGKPVHQHWSLSSDDTALFYPGNPAHLIEKLRSAKIFYFQFPPAGKVPEVITIDVDHLPKAVVP